MKSLKTLIIIVMMAGVKAIWADGIPSLTTLVSFAVTNGSHPTAPLVQGADGNFYGTTTTGGTGGQGTIFCMTPWGDFTNLFSLDDTDGADPRAGLTLGEDGAFYGTAYSGGPGNFGTIFRMTAQTGITRRYSFAFADGGYPVAGLELGQDGNFYGTAAIGGPNSGGLVFSFNPNGTMTPLFSFGFSGTNGDSPYAKLLQTRDGTFYGSTYQGGSNGCGTLFTFTTNGIFNTVHLFTGTNDGANPYAGLIQMSDGSLYGTTAAGGAAGGGTIFKLTTNGAFSVVSSFGITNGANPQAELVQTADGSIYGTTAYGGAFTNQSGVGYGTVFRLDTNGALATLVSFNATNGANPQAALALGSDGSLYGTTANGGAGGNGTVFRLDLGSPPPPNFSSIVEAGSTVRLAWHTLVGFRYQIEYQTNLSQTGWLDLAETTVATNATTAVSDPLGQASQRFYRAVLLR